MLNIFKTKFTELIPGMTDTHSHLMYGVDDGVKSETEFNEILEILIASGVKKIFFTPHIKAELPLNTAENLTSKFNHCTKNLNNKIEVKLCAEYMLDELFITKLNEEKLLTYDGKHLLIEMSSLSAPPNLEEIIFQINISGYIPIIAHPERYNLHLNYNQFASLKNSGCKFQLNTLSLSNAYGSKVKKCADKLLSEGMYDYIGSDIHNPAYFNYVRDIRLNSDKITAIKALIASNSKLFG